jgi:hypothetical protein
MTERELSRDERIQAAAAAIKDVQRVLKETKVEGRDVTDGEIDGRLVWSARKMREIQGYQEDMDFLHAGLIEVGFPDAVASLFILAFHDNDVHYDHLFSALAAAQGPALEQLDVAYTAHLESFEYHAETFRSVSPTLVAQIEGLDEHPLGDFTKAFFGRNTLVQVKVNNALRWQLLVRSGWATAAFAGEAGRLASIIAEGGILPAGDVFSFAEHCVDYLFHPMWIGVFKHPSGSIPIAWPVTSEVVPPFSSMYCYLEQILRDNADPEYWHHGIASPDGALTVYRFAADNAVQNSAGSGYSPFNKTDSFETPIYLTPLDW